MSSRVTMRVYFFIAIALVITGCVRPNAPFPARASEDPRWTFTTATTPKGVFLVVHGLNLKPSALDPLCGFLASKGFHSYRMTLRGHNEAPESYFDASEWRLDVATAYARIRSRFPTLPPYALGYSIGGLLLTQTFESDPSLTKPRGMILLAPAISMKTAFDIAAALRLPPPVSWSVPNLAPPAYRRYELTPLFWYSNALELYTMMSSIQNTSRLKAIPTLIVLNPSDELVSEDGTRNWIDARHLTPEWSVALVHPAPSERFLKEHLIIDKNSLGPREWARFQDLVSDFLKGIEN